MYIKINVVDDKIKCTVSEKILDVLDKKYLPLKFKVYSQISENVLYECDLMGGMWSIYNTYKNVFVKIFTNNNILLRRYECSYLEDFYNDAGLYEFWDYYIKTNKSSVGVIIGCGDGEWGEWTLPVNEHEIKCHLIEASENTFERLKKNYKNKKYANLYNLIITKDGKKCNFYDVNLDDGLSTTNLNYLKNILSSNSSSHFNFNFDDINFGVIKERNSIKINDFLEIINDFDWLRIDAEGIDYDLIMSIDNKFLNKLKMIQYEHLDLEKYKQEEISILLGRFGFRKIVYKIDTIFVK